MEEVQPPLRVTQPYIDIPQRTPGWFQARKRTPTGKLRLTASNVYSAMTPSGQRELRARWSGHDAAYKARLEACRSCLDWGTEHESDAINYFLHEYLPSRGEGDGPFFAWNTGMWVDPTNDRLGGSPDHLVYSNGNWIVVEAKCKYSLQGVPRLPDNRRPQRPHLFQLYTNMLIIARALQLERIQGALVYWTPDETAVFFEERSLEFLDRTVYCEKLVAFLLDTEDM